jgi:hypothetical protein
MDRPSRRACDIVRHPQQFAPTMPMLSRRIFLALLAAAAAPWRARALHATAPPAFAQGAAASVDGFLALCSRLTGHRQLDPAVGRIYLDALLASPARRGLLLDLLDGRGTSQAHADVERDIVEWWYTGLYDADGVRRVATHSGALVWQVLGRPAPGACAGTTGDWSRPPAHQ